MSAPSIRALGVSKEYVRGGHNPSLRTFREALVGTVTGRFRPSARPALKDDRFLALSDVSFDVHPGEVMGIIGRNGAGKSTLLKILSRITAPTTGRIEVRGRIASLLEVGTGFHPELTGRENIRLNGAIIGMTSSEVARKFDRIVAFSEVEKFIDTPIKHYSSGMYTRLAFAVAAHLEPEILIVDEVLAVGDAEFQKKCLGKMNEIAGQGRTVLLVSHNLSAIGALCQNAILLDGGRILHHGAAADTIAHYSGLFRGDDGVVVEDKPPSGPHIASATLATNQILFGEKLAVTCMIQSPNRRRVAIEVEIHDGLGRKLIYSSTAPMHGQEFDIYPGANRLMLEIGALPLARGSYELHLWLSKPWVEEFHRLSQPICFDVVQSDPGRVGFDFQQSYERGCVAVPITFERQE
ncbi:hypothetical protein BA190_00925 [Labrys sp. WJW]|uniref:ABC transporter ATP-binding protein n=1 Tax=Labrys sp. WJW TaxID=1737983 RepID=UPI0008369629|nr:ABC transporter ATP-binding protein [Labrys sp. WJW]OCC06825.1 hypothetical protein BA190_00925 [Labrys sp. WJW]